QNDSYVIAPIQAGMLFHAIVRTCSGVDIEQIVAHLEEPVNVNKLIEGWRHCRMASQMIMVWTFHHILLDGRSFPFLLREVSKYGDRQLGEPKHGSSAPPESCKHVEWLHARDEDASRPYWKEYLAGFRAPVRLWVESPYPSRARGEEPAEFGNLEIHASPEAAASMKGAASAAGVTMNTLLQGVWALRLSSERDIVYGATRACRRSGVPGV